MWLDVNQNYTKYFTLIWPSEITRNEWKQIWCRLSELNININNNQDEKNQYSPKFKVIIHTNFSLQPIKKTCIVLSMPRIMLLPFFRSNFTLISYIFRSWKQQQRTNSRFLAEFYQFQTFFCVIVHISLTLHAHEKWIELRI